MNKTAESALMVLDRSPIESIYRGLIAFKSMPKRGAPGSSTPWSTTFDPTATGSFTMTRLRQACKKNRLLCDEKLQKPESRLTA
jgi:hypothetical protein